MFKSDILSVCKYVYIRWWLTVDSLSVNSVHYLYIYLNGSSNFSVFKLPGRILYLKKCVCVWERENYIQINVCILCVTVCLVFKDEYLISTLPYLLNVQWIKVFIQTPRSSFLYRKEFNKKRERETPSPTKKKKN